MSAFGQSYKCEKVTNTIMCNASHIVALFDESFNKTSKRGQMDMHVWYWDNNHNYVATRYYHSEFMGKASTKDVHPLAHAHQVSAKASCSRFLLIAQTWACHFLAFLRNTRMRKNWANLFILEPVVYILHSSMKHGEKESGWN